MKSLAVLPVLLGLMGSGPLGVASAGQVIEGSSWREVKCALYRQGWSEALTRVGKQGLGDEFIARHEAFLSSGCTTQADVCPRSEEELRLANIMVVLAMNAGTASTFPPFACRK